MHKLGGSQRHKVAQVMEYLGVSAESGIKLLRNTGWSTDAAVNEFLDNPGPYTPDIDTGKIEAIFQQFKDKESPEDIIGMDGLLEMYEGLGCTGTDLETLILNFQFRSKSAEKITHQEFVNGMIRCSCESLADLKERLPKCRGDLASDNTMFKEFYMFCFDYSKEQEQHKYLALDVAIMVWELVLEGKYPGLALWFTFLNEEHGKPVQRDAWQLFFDFTVQVKPDCSNYDCEAGGAWPCLIDDYVDWLKEKKHIK